MELSHWNLVDSFTLWEAAYLAAGVDPNSSARGESAKAKLIYRELEKADDLAVSAVTFNLTGRRFAPGETLDSVFSFLGDDHRDALPSNQLYQEANACLRGRDFNFNEYVLGSDESSPRVFSRERLDAWFHAKGFVPVCRFVPTPEGREALRNSEGSAADSAPPIGIGRREQQHEIILAVIAALDFDPLNVPDGGKAKIKAACLTRPRLFTADSFDHAWKAGLASGLFKMANHRKFTSIK